LLGADSDLASEGVDDVLGYHQAQANALGARLARVLDAAEKFEKLRFILLLNADARVDYRNDQLVCVLLWLYYIINLVFPLELTEARLVAHLSFLLTGLYRLLSSCWRVHLCRVDCR